MVVVDGLSDLMDEIVSSTSTNTLSEPSCDGIIKTLPKKKARGGGTACCIPGCGNSTRRNPSLSFHRFPKDQRLRNTWIHRIGRSAFTPNDHHRVCSEHFPDGKKTYLNNIPTHADQTPNLLHQRTVLAELSKNTNQINIAIEVDKVNEVQSPQQENIEPIEENIQDKVQRLEDELANLKEKYEKDTTSLKDDLKRNSFSVDRFKSSDTDFEFYTGFQNYDRFKVFYNYLSPACTKLSYAGSKNGKIESAEQKKRGRKRSLSPEEELFLVLTKLRCGLLERDLAARYNISVSQVSNIWITWLDFLYQRLRSIPIWPSRKHVDATMPASFKENFPQTRVVIDCTEMFIEMPSAPVTQGVTFSSYKHHNTAKGLVSISPAGTLTFVSELYAGRTSDKELTKDCGILKLLEEGDQIMADKGFLIEDCLPDGVTLNIPPFLKDQNQLSIEDEVKTRRIAKERIHVERAIEKIKNFRILQQVIPLSMAADINKIWIVCSYLTLFFKPLVVSAQSH